MRIIICIKQVRSELVYHDKNNGENYTINPYDLFALQQILKLKKQHEQIHITCLCMGLKGAQDVLIKCIGSGVDEAILLNDSAFAGADTLATCYILKKAIQRIGYFDLIVCGAQSIDGETGQVVFGLAEQLKLPFETDVNHIVSVKEKEMLLNCIDGNDETEEMIKLPALLSFHGFTTQQETINLLALKKARKKGITIWGLSELAADVNKCGKKGSRTEVIELKENFVKKETIKIDGSISQKAEVIYQLIQNIGNG